MKTQLSRIEVGREEESVERSSAVRAVRVEERWGSVGECCMGTVGRAQVFACRLVEEGMSVSERRLWVC